MRSKLGGDDDGRLLLPPSSTTSSGTLTGDDMMVSLSAAAEAKEGGRHDLFYIHTCVRRGGRGRFAQDTCLKSQIQISIQHTDPDRT